MSGSLSQGAIVCRHVYINHCYLLPFLFKVLQMCC